MSEFDPPAENQEGDASIPSENWDCYIFNTEDGPVINMLNLDERPADPNLHTTRCLIRVQLLVPDEYGFSTPDEDKMLWAIEDALAEMMQDQRGGRYVGRSTHGGKRVFCYYMEESQVPGGGDVAAALQHVEGYTPEMNVTVDQEWEYYFEFLYPTPEMMQCMQNRNLIQVLGENDDHFEVPREIDHWIYFEKTDDRDRYKQAVVEQLGFQVRDEGQKEDGVYSLQIYREDPIDPHAIDETVLTLFAMAKEHGGNYDGWETPVVKDAEPEGGTGEG